MDNTDTSLPGGNAPAHWYDTWDRQTSQSFSNTAKGLRNAPGENNCFLNSAVQVSNISYSFYLCLRNLKQLSL